MSTMTLKDVSRQLRNLASDGMFGVMADVIDAELTSREAKGEAATEVLLSYDFTLYLNPESADSAEVKLVCGFSIDDKDGRKAAFHAEDAAGNSIRLIPTPQQAAQPAKQAGSEVMDGCTESNCPRCLTAPYARGDMEHAGIGTRPITQPKPEQAVGDQVMWAVLDNTGAFWMTPVGMAYQNKKEAEDFIEWATKHRPDTSPYKLAPLYTTPRPAVATAEDGVDVDKALDYMRNFRPLRNALDTFDSGDLHDFEEGLRAALASRPVEAAQGEVVDDGFDTWQKNPYTKILQASIANDYVPKAIARATTRYAPGASATTSPTPILTHGGPRSMTRALCTC